MRRRRVPEGARGRLWAQLGWVFERESERAVPDPYALPRVLPTPEQAAESDRLRAIADELFARAAAEGFEETGLDPVFDDSP